MTLKQNNRENQTQSWFFENISEIVNIKKDGQSKKEYRNYSCNY